MGQTSVSPKMVRLIGNKLTKVLTGYYGPFTFLDNQAAFDEVFGADPVIRSMLPLQKSTTLKEQIDAFIKSQSLAVHSFWHAPSCLLFSLLIHNIAFHSHL